MRTLFSLPGFIAAFGLVLALNFSGSAAEAESCPSGSARLSTWGALTGASQGGTASVNFTVAADCNVQLSLVSYKAPAATFSESDADQQVIFDTATATLAAGPHSLSVSVPNCFFQVDFVFGAAIAHLGPAGSGNFYSAQGRLISAVNGGTMACAAAAPGTGSTGDTGSTGGDTTPATTPGTTDTGTTATTTPVVTTQAVTPAGPITWAPGFGPGGVVASVQTAPTAVAGSQSAPVVRVANLPSTSTADDNNGVILLGIASVGLGLVLLRAGRRAPARGRLD